MSVRLQVLGRVGLDVTGKDVPLTRLETTLLAALAMSAGSMATYDALADWLWGEELPSSPKNRLQALVSGLRRKVLPTRLIVTSTDGYRLARGVLIDVVAWQALVQRANGAESEDHRRELLHRAGRAFTADPLRGCASTPRVDAARRHLQEERLRVIEARLEADLRAGDLAPLVAELTRLVEEHPFHEGFAAQLMTVLARTGRQADAVSTYGRIRDRLDAELGVRPGELMEAARAAIVRGHPSMSAPPAARTSPWVAVGAAPRTVPRSVAPVVGRDEIFARIAEATTSRVVPAVVALTGVGGIGKTSLAVESAHRLRDRFDGGSLYVDMSGEVGQSGVAAVLDSFLTMLGVRGPDLPERLPDRAAVFRSILDDRRILVVLDDIPPGYDVSALLPARPGSMAILTSRQPVRGVVATHLIRLGFLDDASSLRLLGTYVDAARLDAAPAGARALVSLCGGLPLLLRMVGQRLARRPELSVEDASSQLAEEFAGRRSLTDDDGRLGAGLGVAEAQLPRQARALLADLSRLPFPHASRQTCVAVCGSEQAADEALEPLVQLGILDAVVHVGADPVYRMHDLIRLHAARSADSLPPVDLRGIGRRLVATARRYAASFPDQLLPPPSPTKDLDGPPEPQDSVRYFVTEMEVLLSAVRALSPVDADAAWELLILVAPAARRHTDVWLGADVEVRAALDLTKAGRANAYLSLAAGVLLLDLPLSRERLRALEHARRHFTTSGDHPAAVATAVVLSRAYQLAGDHDAAVTHLTWVGSQLHEDSPVPARAHVAFAWGRLHDAYDVLVSARDAQVESVSLFARTTDWVGLAAAELELAHACRRLGDHATGMTWVHEAAALYEQLHDVTGYTACLDAMADLLVQLGQPDDALARADLAVAAATQHLDSFTQHRAERTRGRALAALHRDGEAEESFRASAAGFEAMGRPFSLAGTLRDLSGLLGRQGRRAEARAVLHAEHDILRRAGAKDLTVIERLLHEADLQPTSRD